MPIQRVRCHGMRSRYARHGADEVAERVAAELLACRARKLERDSRFGDDGERLDRRDVAALDERLCRLARLEVDGGSGFISVGSGFIAARTTISSPFETPASMPPARFVSRT